MTPTRWLAVEPLEDRFVTAALRLPLVPLAPVVVAPWQQVSLALQGGCGLGLEAALPLSAFYVIGPSPVDPTDAPAGTPTPTRTGAALTTSPSDMALQADYLWFYWWFSGDQRGLLPVDPGTDPYRTL